MVFAPEQAPVTHASIGGDAERLLFRLAVCARILFGFIFFVSGLNWWWKILPYPSMHDPVFPHTPHFIQAMIDTGDRDDYSAVWNIEIHPTLKAAARDGSWKPPLMAALK